MRTKNTMIKRMGYYYNELDTLAEYLEKQAEEGWELTTKTGAMLGFRRTEPRKVKINVEMVYQDDGLSAHQSYFEFCRAVGWKHIFNDGKIQIFENDDLDAEPIHTDPQIKLEAVHRKCLEQRVIFPAVSLACLLFVIWNLYKSINYYDFLSYASLNIYLNLIVAVIFCIIDPLLYLCWYRKAKKEADVGLQPKYVKKWYNHVIETVALIILFGICAGDAIDVLRYENSVQGALLICLLVVILIGILVVLPVVRARTNTDKTSDKSTFLMWGVIAFVIFFCISQITFDFRPAQTEYKENIPLTLEDMQIEASGEMRRTEEVKSTVLLKEIVGSDYTENAKGKHISYSICETSFEKVADIVLNTGFFRRRENYKEVSEPAFGAEKVYGNGEFYLLFYGNRMAEITANFDFSDEQKQIIGDKLLRGGAL